MALRSQLKIDTTVVPLAKPADVVEGQEAKPRAKTTPGRAGKSQVAFFVDPAAKRQLETICFQERRRLQAVMEEALDLLFRSRGMTRTGQHGAGG